MICKNAPIDTMVLVGCIEELLEIIENYPLAIAEANHNTEITRLPPDTYAVHRARRIVKMIKANPS